MMPIASATTAKIGTPSTNAANIRWISAAIQIAARLPITGKSRYAPAVSAAAWSKWRMLAIGDHQKQILRAFGAQDDTLLLVVKKETGKTTRFPSFFFKGALGHVILSERAERARAKELLVAATDHWSRRTASASRNRSASRCECRPEIGRAH